MALEPGNDIRNTEPAAPVYPTYAHVNPSPDEKPEKVTAQLMTGGASIEAIGGIAAIVLAVIGLTGNWEFYMTGIATIVVGGAIFVHGISVAARWRQTIEAFRAEREQEVVVGGGVGSETFGGAAGVVLGILALAGTLPMVLLPVAAIVLGAAVFLAGPAQPELASLGFDRDRRYRRAEREGERAAGGLDILAGAGAAVLGILALVHIGTPLVMTMVAMLALGGALLISGGTMAATFGKRLQHA